MDDEDDLVLLQFMEDFEKNAMQGQNQFNHAFNPGQTPEKQQQQRQQKNASGSAAMSSNSNNNNLNQNNTYGHNKTNHHPNPSRPFSSIQNTGIFSNHYHHQQRPQSTKTVRPIQNYHHNPQSNQSIANRPSYNNTFNNPNFISKNSNLNESNVSRHDTTSHNNNRPNLYNNSHATNQTNNNGDHNINNNTVKPFNSNCFYSGNNQNRNHSNLSLSTTTSSGQTITYPLRPQQPNTAPSQYLNQFQQQQQHSNETQHPFQNIQSNSYQSHNNQSLRHIYNFQQTNQHPSSKIESSNNNNNSFNNSTSNVPIINNINKQGTIKFQNQIPSNQVKPMRNLFDVLGKDNPVSSSNTTKNPNFSGSPSSKKPSSSLANRNRKHQLIEEDPFPIESDLLPCAHEIDTDNINTWVYPSNRPIRDYQFNIVQKALFSNTLVALPTGLGKTMIAAVVMFNFYRWFPKSKIVFMAPTKPLVAQQIQACHEITGISPFVMEELTGSVNASKRELSWYSKRIFFTTPQVLKNDLSKGSCPAHDICLLVVDEAHRATGNHAYCEVVREMEKKSENSVVFGRCQYRILALTATPGSDLKTVQEVVSNLRVSKIEIRTEDSIDIRPYTHQRDLSTVVVPVCAEIQSLQKEFAQIIGIYTARLHAAGAFFTKDPGFIHHFQFLQARDRFRETRRPDMSNGAKAAIEGNFGVAIFLSQAQTLLYQHGIRTFYSSVQNYLQEADAAPKISRAKTELIRNKSLLTMMDRLQNRFKDPLFESHPKMVRLVGIVLEHFTQNEHQKENIEQAAADKNNSNNNNNREDTRVMIFSQYRESVEEIVNALRQHHPLLRVVPFIGQSSGKKSGKGYTQKEQLEVIENFQKGIYNVIVATCIGEEGLDIGQVDLIICYDSQASPIRMLQRMGRTGRKRSGRIVLLLTQGKEEEAYKRSQSQYKSVQRGIIDQKSLVMVKSDRMVPEKPNCVKEMIDINAGDMKMHKELMKRGNKAKRSNSSKSGSRLFDAIEKENGDADSLESAKKKPKQSRARKKKEVSPHLILSPPQNPNPQDADWDLENNISDKTSTKPVAPKRKILSINESQEPKLVLPNALEDDDDFADFTLTQAISKSRARTPHKIQEKGSLASVQFENHVHSSPKKNELFQTQVPKEQAAQIQGFQKDLELTENNEIDLLGILDDLKSMKEVVSVSSKKSFEQDVQQVDKWNEEYKIEIPKEEPKVHLTTDQDDDRDNEYLKWPHDEDLMISMRPLSPKREWNAMKAIWNGTLNDKDYMKPSKNNFKTSPKVDTLFKPTTDQQSVQATFILSDQKTPNTRQDKLPHELTMDFDFDSSFIHALDEAELDNLFQEPIANELDNDFRKPKSTNPSPFARKQEHNPIQSEQDDRRLENSIYLNKDLNGSLPATTHDHTTKNLNACHSLHLVKNINTCTPKLTSKFVRDEYSFKVPQKSLLQSVDSPDTHQVTTTTKTANHFTSPISPLSSRTSSSQKFNPNASFLLLSSSSSILTQTPKERKRLKKRVAISSPEDIESDDDNYETNEEGQAHHLSCIHSQDENTQRVISSPGFLIRNTPLAVRLERKRNAVRKPPKQRFTPIITKKTKSTDGPEVSNGKNKQQNKKILTRRKDLDIFLDKEAAMSMSDGEGGLLKIICSSDEISEEEKDLEGFITGDSSELATGTSSPSNMLAVYHRSLFSQNQCGFNHPQNENSKQFFSKTATRHAYSGPPSTINDDEAYESDIGSLVDFIVEEDEDEPLYGSMTQEDISDDIEDSFDHPEPNLSKNTRRNASNAASDDDFA